MTTWPFIDIAAYGTIQLRFTCAMKRRTQGPNSTPFVSNCRGPNSLPSPPPPGFSNTSRGMAFGSESRIDPRPDPKRPVLFCVCVFGVVNGMDDCDSGTLISGCCDWACCPGFVSGAAACPRGG